LFRPHQGKHRLEIVPTEFSEYLCTEESQTYPHETLSDSFDDLLSPISSTSNFLKNSE
jgi:hypothetical protein